ncbi:MAG: RHS repeat-associated core domain-containing protein [Phycisphaerae bacterium]|nr:RHS repeat-associated core domain-containing protein [Phycisphaerae bacterium]
MTRDATSSLLDAKRPSRVKGNRITYNVDDSQTSTHYCTNAVNQYDATGAASGCASPTEAFDYDADGNLETDGALRYLWDAENRLIEAFPTTPAAGDVKVRFAYDYMGRRVRKEVLAWNDGASDWAATATTDLKFVYDGWHVVQVLDGTTTGNPVTQQYTWGLDLSGTLGSAGGIGGLLAAVETKGTSSTTDDDAYWYFYDGNGNVGQVIAADGQTLAAHYEYDPYGNLIASSGTYADTNPIRFSTKWFDVETSLYYYGYRYLWRDRWLNRDPIEEDGGLNLYAFVENCPLRGIDPLGLIPPRLFDGPQAPPIERQYVRNGRVNDCVRQLSKACDANDRCFQRPKNQCLREALSLCAGYVDGWPQWADKNQSNYPRGYLQCGDCAAGVVSLGLSNSCFKVVSAGNASLGHSFAAVFHVCNQSFTSDANLDPWTKNSPYFWRLVSYKSRTTPRLPVDDTGYPPGVPPVAVDCYNDCIAGLGWCGSETCKDSCKLACGVLAGP